MREIERVAILGAGALGAYFATRFYETPGFDTGLVAGGERGDRLRRDGLVVNDRVYQISVLDPAEPGPSADLILLIGGDSLRDLPTWHRPADLVSASHEIGVIRRPGDSINLSVLERSVPGTQAKVRFVEAPLLEIASSDIRRRIRAGQPFRYYVSQSVYEYILNNKLYR